MSFFVLLLTLTVYLIRPAEWIPGLDLRWNLILNILGALALIWATMTGRTKIVVDRTWAYVTLFLIFMIVSNLAHAQTSTIGIYLPGMLTNVLVYLLVPVALRSPRQAEWFIVILTAAVLFICYQCYLQSVNGTNWAGLSALQRRSVELLPQGGVITTYTPQAIWVGVFHDPNDLGLLLVCFTPLAMAKTFFIRSGLLVRLFWACALGAIIYTIYLTNSRGTFVALLAAIVAFFIIKHRSAVGLMLASAAGFILITFGPSRMSSISSGDSAAMERVFAWILALELFSMNPIVGVGARHWGDFHGRQTHNSYVLAFVENGFFGYVCYLSLFIIAMYVAVSLTFREEDKRIQLTATALAACMTGCMASIFFISRTYVLIPFLLSSLVISYCKVANAEVFEDSIKKLNPVILGAIAAASIVTIWIVNKLSTAFML
ncbi:O-antigen ligase family protein [Congregibacter sp.]|jgi:putative inorganic carbon (HCO3(-)) transporter|uniref:O-antigen ligase family protein n=1 Tax=Congregibacter sp. TaxID=2744308 RepID=UPI0039E357A8